MCDVAITVKPGEKAVIAKIPIDMAYILDNYVYMVTVNSINRKLLMQFTEAAITDLMRVCSQSDQPEDKK